MIPSVVENDGKGEGRPERPSSESVLATPTDAEEAAASARIIGSRGLESLDLTNDEALHMVFTSFPSSWDSRPAAPQARNPFPICRRPARLQPGGPPAKWERRWPTHR